jgi:hypothetical protein
VKIKTCRECGELIWKSGLCASCYGTLRDEELKARDYENGKCEDCDKGESNV